MNKRMLKITCLSLAILAISILTHCAEKETCDWSYAEEYCQEMETSCDGEKMTVSCSNSEEISDCQLPCTIYCHYNGFVAHTGECQYDDQKELDFCECR